MSGESNVDSVKAAHKAKQGKLQTGCVPLGVEVFFQED